MRNMESSLNGKIPNKIIQEIYQSAEKIYSKSVVLLWKKAEQENTAKILISVPKKNIKNAVDRNRIKRLIRESYRLQKSITNKIILHNKNLAILLVYSSSKTNVTFKEIFDKINLILQSLKKKQNEKN